MVHVVYAVLFAVLAGAVGVIMGGCMRAAELQDLRLRLAIEREAYAELCRRIRQGRVRPKQTDTRCFHAQGTARDRLAQVWPGLAVTAGEES